MRSLASSIVLTTYSAKGISVRAGVTVLPPQTGYAWVAARGKMGGQHEFPRVLTKKQVAEWQTFIRDPHALA